MIKGFNDLFKERKNQLNRNVYGSIEEIEENGKNIQTSLLNLTTESMGLSKGISKDPSMESLGLSMDSMDSNIKSCNVHLGKSLSIMMIIRSFLHDLKQEKCYLPLDLLSKHGLIQQDLIKNEFDHEILKNVIFELATRCNDQYLTSLTYCNSIYSLPVKTYLDRLEKVDFNVFHPNLYNRNFLDFMKLLWKINQFPS
jgi:NADH dehydrogenase [ubiquinone] 1 alpha subcomplex assembly factor 6